MTDNLMVVYQTYFADDKDRNEYVPNELKVGVNKFIEDKKIGVVFEFLSKYVRKLYADSHIWEERARFDLHRESRYSLRVT